MANVAVTRMSTNIWWRRVLAADLFFYNLANFFFAWLPMNQVNKLESFFMFLCASCAGLVVSHASTRISLPFDEWGYLLTGAVGLFILLIYGFGSDHNYEIKIPFCVYLMSGIVSGYAAHVIDGGTKNA